ncbi:MAG: O-antigen/teichoic acid export membrane protein [Candidatus Aldehydirespiratoraceae bacterium]
MTHDSGWSEGVVAKISKLLSARMLAQVIAISWFLGIARVFDSGELGILAAGLVAFATVSVLSDMGTTWSIAREVTGRPDLGWGLYRQALRVRSLGVLAIGGTITLVAAVLVDRRMLIAIMLGVVLALVSGASELGMSTLRSVGTIGAESIALPLERAVFLVLATGIVSSGRGPNPVLVAYIATNLVTAVIMYRKIRRELRPLASAGEVPSLWSGETRRVGVAFAVLALGPRANALVLVLLASRWEVADYSVASRPVEQFALTVFGFSTTMLPLLRSDHLGGRDPAERMGGIAAGVTLVALPGIVWAMLAPGPIIDLIYGADRYPGAPTVLALVAIVAVTWPLRGLAGLVMVARDDAAGLARISFAGLLLNLAMVIPLATQYGATGVAIALVVSELATSTALVVHSGLLHRSDSTQKLGTGAALGVCSGVLASMLPLAFGIVIVAVGTAGAVALALIANRQIARTGQVVWA